MCAVLWMICYFDRLHCKDLKVLIKSKYKLTEFVKLFVLTNTCTQGKYKSKYKLAEFVKLFVLTNTCTQGISQQTLQSLIDFIYTGRVALCQENVQVFISNPIYSVLWLGKLPGFPF